MFQKEIELNPDNYLDQDFDLITCAYCKRVGHGAVNCVKLAIYYGRQRRSK